MEIGAWRAKVADSVLDVWETVGMALKRKVFVHTEALNEGGYPAECPFNTTRASRTRQTLDSMGLLSGEDRGEVAPVKLSREELARFHTQAYLDVLTGAGEGDIAPDEAVMVGLGTADCPIFANMHEYVALAAGGSVTAARLLLSGEADFAFNPSGGFHHAQAGRAAGFCYVNDVVLAALTLTDAGKRVLFLDIDVHHGDGVQDAFYQRDDVMTMSMHESGRTLFPGTGFADEIGIDAGRGYSVNVPLPVGTDDMAYLRIFRQTIAPLIKAYDADVLIVELGMDALAGDPLAHLHLTNNAHAEILQTLVDMDKPLLMTGGGGYHVENTVRGWALGWSVLCGETTAEEDLMFGMGGVMLQNTDWIGGLRDRVLLSDGGRHDTVDADIKQVTGFIHREVFPLHGLERGGADA